MRSFPLLLCVALLGGCKKHPQPTLPQIPDASPMAGGGNTELPEAMIFHTVYRSPGHAGQVHAFFKPELEKRGAKQAGDVWGDENLVHTGGFCGQGSATPKEATRPGVLLAQVELPEATRGDDFEISPSTP